MTRVDSIIAIVTNDWNGMEVDGPDWASDKYI